jgi:hypothetical protein
MARFAVDCFRRNISRFMNFLDKSYINIGLIFDIHIRCDFGRQKIWGFTLGSTVSHYATSLFS